MLDKLVVEIRPFRLAQENTIQKQKSAENRNRRLWGHLSLRARLRVFALLKA
jgi:hypothetical protein